MTSIGFIGAGRITRIMIEGWKRAGRLSERIVVSDASETAVESIAVEFAERAAGGDEAPGQGAASHGAASREDGR